MAVVGSCILDNYHLAVEGLDGVGVCHRSI